MSTTIPALPVSPVPAVGSLPAFPPVAAQTISVLHLVNGEHFAGAERVQSHLGRCLPDCGVRADFACVKPGRFAQHLRQQDGRGGGLYETPMRGRVDLRCVRQLTSIVEAGDYDVLHAHTPRTAMLAAWVANRTGRPWVYHVHSPAARDSSRWLINGINAWVERLSIRCCSHLITVSQSLREACLHRGWNEDRVTVVHNGVPACRPERSTFPEPGGRWTLGMVALMRPRKGLEVALDALAALNRAGREVHLECIGPFETEPYQRRIEAQVDRLGLRDRVAFTGFASDIPARLSRLDALLLPSLYGEGLPMVVLEAMAAALPVVATRVEGTPEAIRHGREGLLAEPGCATSLAAQIRDLVDGHWDWHPLAEAACRRHRDAFSDQAMARGTAAVYRRVLGP